MYKGARPLASKLATFTRKAIVANANNKTIIIGG